MASFAFAVSVHPHSRGELIQQLTGSSRYVGSSPLAWGVARLRRRFVGDFRFIPTRVGSWSIHPRGSFRPAVHPHSRGELGSGYPPPPPNNGSSPLAWGVEIGELPASQTIRFIPTRVGSCFGASRQGRDLTVHPHSRGELERDSAPLVTQCGSSPLAWGVGIPFPSGPEVARFIPTRVGSWPSPVRARCALAVHPHSRGELKGFDAPGPRPDGSSPLAWGVAIELEPDGLRDRFIPTRVGSWY